MTTRIYTDRSRIETFQRCNRQRYLEYHAGPGDIGLVPTRKPLPLAVGGAVHRGLEELLRGGQALYDLIGQDSLCWMDTRWRELEERAVAAALADFHAVAGEGLEVDLSERTAMTGGEGGAAGAAPDEFTRQLQAQAQAMGMSAEEVAGLALAGEERRASAMGAFDQYLVGEQAALVEALVRAYARRRLRPLLEEYEVMEVEREGAWQLDSWERPALYNIQGLHLEPPSETWELWFMSRPDALLRSRADNQLYLLSFKTTGAWDMRKAKDAERDMQGLSEGVEVERRLAEWWQDIQDCKDADSNVSKSLLKSALIEQGASGAMRHYLHSLSTPPRVLGIRYEYLLKGERWRDKDLSARLGVDARSQRSHLIRQYVATSTPKKGDGGYSLGDVCWAWDYVKEDGGKGTLAWQNWRSQAVWEQAGNGLNRYADTGLVKAWIDLLDQTTETMSGYDTTTGMEPRRLGWGGPAQRMGYTAEHPLDQVFVPPVMVYRHEDDLRDWVEQVGAQERRVAEAVVAVAAAGDEGERRSLLNQHFVQTRRACEYPSTCAFVRLCWGSEDARRDPVGTGQFRSRVPNHPQELSTENISK